MRIKVIALFTLFFGMLWAMPLLAIDQPMDKKQDTEVTAFTNVQSVVMQLEITPFTGFDFDTDILFLNWLKPYDSNYITYKSHLNNYLFECYGGALQKKT